LIIITHPLHNGAMMNFYKPKDLPRGEIFTRIVNTAEDMDGVTTLWKEIYGKEFGWLDEQADPCTDNYHGRSTYYISWLNNTIPVGTMRIVRSNDMGFHITEAVKVRSLYHRQPIMVEVQRLMIAPGIRDKRFLGAPFGVYGCMVKACFHHSIANGVDIILADCHLDVAKSPLESMKKMGFKETGETYVDSMNGLNCTILIMETKSWIRNIYNNQSNFNNYFLDIKDWSISKSNISGIDKLYLPNEGCIHA